MGNPAKLQMRTGDRTEALSVWREKPQLAMRNMVPGSSFLTLGVEVTCSVESWRERIPFDPRVCTSLSKIY